ncbi:hypothetical protein [Aureimonas pseudogalii]|uniref:Uncharacterized protein n=1 Tax=Aureimonas pseudogalii TaxID=1744844 RepID=A0A7W6H911_9HYPH|nr:hypothetical protein [Aureimonas pseudogalii]MBB4000849.1 hypothetical protein [Aureimonas pseudogalii]
MPDIYAIAASVNELAQPGIKPKDLIEAVRERHPKASKKNIVRGAFLAVITHADADPDKVAQMHETALSARSTDDEAPVSTKVEKRSQKKPKAAR